MSAEIVSRLITPIDQLVASIIPGGIKRTGKTIVARVPWREDNDPSLKIEADSGLWKDWGRGDGGGLLDLVARVLKLADRATAARWLEDNGHLRPDPTRHAPPFPRQPKPVPEQPPYVFDDREDDESPRPPRRPIPEDGDALDKFAALRGFSRLAIESVGARIGATVGGKHRLDCLEIPMRNHAGKITGWRQRRADGQPIKPPKTKALTNSGGKLGLIGNSPLPLGPTFIVEGETDALAILSAWPDVAVLAIPGNQPGDDVFASLAHVACTRDAILIADADEAGQVLVDRIAGRDADPAAGKPAIRATLPHVRLGKLPPGYKDIDEALAALPDDLARVTLLEQIATTAERRPRRTNVYTTDHLLANPPPPIQWVVPGILPATGLFILSGPPKLGKSFLALGICWAIAAGGYLFGSDRFATRRANILGLWLEDNPRRMHDRLIALRENLNADAVPTMYFAHECPPIGPALEAYLLTETEQWRGQPIVVIIDILAKVKNPGDGRRNAYEADSDEIGRLQTFAQRNNLCIVVLTHDRKAPAKGDESDPVAGVSGTAGITGAVDGILKLSRKRGSTKGRLSITGREMHEQEFPLVFEDALWMIDTSEQEAEGQQLSDNDRRLLALLEGRVSISVDDVVTELRVSRGHARQMLLRAKTRGVVEMRGFGNYTVSTPNKGGRQ